MQSSSPAPAVSPIAELDDEDDEELQLALALSRSLDDGAERTAVPRCAVSRDVINLIESDDDAEPAVLSARLAEPTTSEQRRPA
eukprot:1127237-Prymnesium_polylepis.1